MAPYGNPEKYYSVMSSLFSLLPRGDYELTCEELEPELLATGIVPRRSGEPIEQKHMDFAASVQLVLEEIVIHVVDHWQQATGLEYLCASGGVIHNSKLNGLIQRRGVFRDYFAHPIAHEPSAAIGAAQITSQTHGTSNPKPKKLNAVYFGSPVPLDPKPILTQWSSFVVVEESAEIAKRTAELLNDGQVIGWVQGRSEYGPRALGNRSILADPRPRDNKDRINAMVKKREAYRPFAPSVIEERAHDFFDLYGKSTCPFMIFVVDVREEWRQQLGAVTHVDGSARIQTVSRVQNEQYWSLLSEFEKLSGIPVLLNTSFNNNAEPIVETVNDAILTFLTTDINTLVVGNCLIQKRASLSDLLAHGTLSVPPYVQLLSETSCSGTSYRIVGNHSRPSFVEVSYVTYDFLKRVVAGEKPQPNDEVIQDLNVLVQKRMIEVST